MKESLGSSLFFLLQNEYCFTALGIACELGKIEVAKTLIDNGADVNYQSKVDFTHFISLNHNSIAYNSG